MNKSILIIEDDKGARMALSKAIEKMGYEVLQAGSGEKALEHLKKKNIKLVLCDIRLPGMDGLEVLHHIKESRPNLNVVMMTAFGTIEKAVKAIKSGAMDFIEKPLDLEIIRNIINNASKWEGYSSDRENIIQEFKEKNIFEGMVGASKTMHEIFETILKVAPTRSTVLITGETGTGKELIARALHNYSHREGPLIPINLSALPDTLIESELFGHAKGAHSSAFKDRKGRIAEADKGTLFLDEVGDIPKNVQVKLLRVIENRTYERLGENLARKVDARFIAATHVNLEKAIEAGKFRQDLYYRLKVFRISLPPLREHPEDIPLLAQKFMEKYSRENFRPVRKISKEAIDLLCLYRWPGNIRELERVIESAVIMVDGNTLLPNHLPAEICQANETKGIIPISVGTSLKEIEKEVIRHTLNKVSGNKTKAAEILKIGIRTLYRKIDEYEL